MPDLDPRRAGSIPTAEQMFALSANICSMILSAGTMLVTVRVSIVYYH